VSQHRTANLRHALPSHRCTRLAESLPVVIAAVPLPAVDVIFANSLSRSTNSKG